MHVVFLGTRGRENGFVCVDLCVPVLSLPGAVGHTFANLTRKKRVIPATVTHATTGSSCAYSHDTNTHCVSKSL